MTKFCVFDTETSGLFDFKLPADHPNQPRLAEFFAIMLNEDGEETGTIHYYVQPDGWELDPGAAEINGLTVEILEEKGVPIDTVLSAWESLIDAGYEFAAYGAQFDGKMMRGEMRRAGRDDRFEEVKNVCIMRAAMSAGVKKAGGGRGWPKLSDCVAFFELEHDDQHTGKGDAYAALAVMRKLQEQDALPEPSVHYAKTKD